MKIPIKNIHILDNLPGSSVYILQSVYFLEPCLRLLICTHKYSDPVDEISILTKQYT